MIDRLTWLIERDYPATYFSIHNEGTDWLRRPQYENQANAASEPVAPIRFRKTIENWRYTGLRTVESAMYRSAVRLRLFHSVLKSATPGCGGARHCKIKNIKPRFYSETGTNQIELIS